MKALSVKEPWATLILRHGKTTENRSREMKYRGPLVICASKCPDRIAAEDWVWWLKQQGLALPSIADLLKESKPGMALGLVDVIGCDREIKTPWDELDQWHIRLENARPFPSPFSQKGQLGLFEVWDSKVRTAQEVWLS